MKKANKIDGKHERQPTNLNKEMKKANRIDGHMKESL